MNLNEKSLTTLELDRVLELLAKAAVSEEARAQGIDRVELNMGEFNEEALRFYEALGFRTYRRYMEFHVD